ncbi:hypothetical protein ACQPZP_09420 [Spirillospora sp. CA-142024]|uniref:hypothetical protein n=1 Tax=Spirillospora sp. CA-142024 TaxID=3240036 RepID=UPI003D944623
MSTKTAVVGLDRSSTPQKAGLATIALIVAVFAQGVGGALTTGIFPRLSAATLIVLIGWPALQLITAIVYREYGRSMFSMGTVGEEKTRIFKTVRGGFEVDACRLRWFFVVVIGLTSLGINIGIAEADSTIGTGPRTAVQTLGTLLAGVLIFVIWKPRRWNQIILRVVLFGSIAYAIALFSSNGNIQASGLMWAGVVGFHMFMVQKALTAFGTTKSADPEENEALSRRYRDIGMTLGNGITFVLIVGWALLNDSFPTPDKFQGALLPWQALYVLVPVCVMVAPVLLMNWARGHLEETEQAMWTSLAPIAGAIAALSLSYIGWANTPEIDFGQWVAIGMVVLVAIALGNDVARDKASEEKDAELERSRAETREANAMVGELTEKVREVTGSLRTVTTERNDAVAKIDQANAGCEAAVADRNRLAGQLDEANARFERLQAELAIPNAEAQPLVKIGGVSVYMASNDVDVRPDGVAIFNGDTTRVTIQGDNYTIVGEVQHGAFLKEGRFTGLVTRGTVSNGACETEVREGELTARPGGHFTIKNKTQSESSLGASSVE